MTANPLSTIPPIGPTTGMTAPPAAGRFKPIDPVRLLRQHVNALIIATIVGLFLGGAIWGAKRKFGPEYASMAQLLATGTPNESDDVSLYGIKQYEIEEIETFIRNQIAVLTSDDMLRDAIQWPAVRNTTWFAQFDDDVRLAAEALADDHLAVSPQRDSTLINLSVRMGNPADAQVVLDALITVYLQNRKIRLENDVATLNAMHIRERERAEDELQRLNLDRARFITENDLATVELQRSEASIEYETLNRQKVAMELELQAAQASIAGMLQANEEDPDRPISEGEEKTLRMESPGIMQREEQIRQLNEQIRTFKAMGYGDEHRMIRQFNEQIASVQEELDGLMNSELRKLRNAQVAGAMQAAEGINAQIADLEERSRSVHAEMKEMTQKLATFEQLVSEIEATRERKLLTEENLAELRQFQNRKDATRVSRAVAPTEGELVSPRWYWIPAIALMTVLSVAGVIFMRELMDQRVKSPDDVKLLPDATLLGMLPSSLEDPSGEAGVERVVEKAPTSLMAEAYRQVRTAVLSRMDRRGYKTLVVVSAQPEAGTSTVVQNLAASLAYNGRNVLIVDSNFRRPSQHMLADVRNDRGLVDILRDDVDAAEVIHRHADLPLSVLPTGKAADSPPELLEGPAFRALMGRLESEYDIVIIDAPPALLTSDSQLLAKHVDAIAVIVRATTDKRGMVERMLRKLDGQRADVLGIVLNGVKTSAGGYFRKSYEDFYNYRADGERGRKTNGRAPKPEKAAKPSRKDKRRAKADLDDVSATNGVTESDRGLDVETLTLDEDDDI